MAVTFEFDEQNGTSPGSTTHGVTTTNWKNLDGATGTDYNTNPITIGNNSFEKWQFGHFSGTWNQISNGKYDHTLTAFGSNITLKGAPTMTADGNKLTYATPSTTANANLTKNITSANGSFPTGAADVWFSKTSQAGTMTASVTNSGSDSAYTNYLTTQLQTAAGAATGDTAQVTLKLQYDEN